jgi:uncharacterized protein YbgA (DUF1722 family)/uncharacterized protein YbbK (DUF523 family)
MSKPASSPIRIGISSCLLGEQVRYDGGHKRDAYLVETLGPYVEWVPVCPEVEMGLGMPRHTLRLVRIGEEVRMIVPRTGADHTEGMRSFSSRRVCALTAQDLCGYILKKGSPSCGMERVRVFDAHGLQTKSGRGLFAAALLERFPNLPVEEEGRLADPRLRENFIERVFAYDRLRSLFAGKWKLGDVVKFHTAHKLLLMAHSPKAYENLGRLLANPRAVPRSTVRARYEAKFMSALRMIATPQRHANVLRHIACYFRNQLDNDSHRELLALIQDYRKGVVPWVVPLMLIRHCVRELQITYLEGQVYLEPHPEELMLKNHV